MKDEQGNAVRPIATGSQPAEPVGLPTEIARQLGGIFRHMLPGVLVIGGARLAYPDWFLSVYLTTWQNIFVLGIISVAVGNAWFAFNRYGLHQVVDYVLYLIKSNGPARKITFRAYLKTWTYLDDLEANTRSDLFTPQMDPSAPASMLNFARQRCY
jgi:hypothetical protein